MSIELDKKEEEFFNVLNQFNTFIIADLKENKRMLATGIKKCVPIEVTYNINKYFSNVPVRHILFELDKVHDYTADVFNQHDFVSWRECQNKGNHNVYRCLYSNKKELEIECFVDINRKESLYERDVFPLELNTLKELFQGYVDFNSSYEKDGVTYMVMDMNKVGIFDDFQKINIKRLFYELDNNKDHEESCTIYLKFSALHEKNSEGRIYTYAGLWDLFNKKPISRRLVDIIDY